MKYSFVFTDSAQEELRSLGSEVASFIIKKLEYYIKLDNPLRMSKSLHGKFKGYFRFRIGEYRAIFIKKPDGTLIILEVVSIAHRKEIYE